MARKIHAIIQARMGSSRLPGKVLRKIKGRPMLHYVIRQVLASKTVDDVIIATTREKSDDVIVEYCRQNHIKVFRGAKNDLLDRYFRCAEKFDCDPVIRITSDCPLIDPGVIDGVFEKFRKNSYDYVGNNLEKISGVWNNSTCNYPQGMTVEISSFNALRKAWKMARKPSEREHVFPYIQFNPGLFRVSKLKMRKNLSHIRCTVDHLEDFRFVQTILDRNGHGRIITINDIENAVKKEPDLLKINGHISFDEGYQQSLLLDKKRGHGRKERIMIRTDGDHELGLGHVYRSVSFAKQLQKNNLKAMFLTKSIGLEKIIPKNFTVRKISGRSSDLQKTIKEINPEMIILDKLRIGSDEMGVLVSNAKVIAIDYVGKNKKMLRNGINMLYPESGAQGVGFLSGFKFTILSDSVRNRRPIKISKSVSNVLVVQGGTDTRCNIPKIIDSMNDIHKKIRINVVVGVSFKCWRELHKSMNDSPHKINLFHNVTDMGRIMKKNDMAVTAGGMTSLELCHLGIPSVIVCGEPFEDETAVLLESNGFGINLGYRKNPSKKKIARAINELMSNYELRRGMNVKGRRLVDGKGAERIVRHIKMMVK